MRRHRIVNVIWDIKRNQRQAKTANTWSSLQDDYAVQNRLNFHQYYHILGASSLSFVTRYLFRYVHAEGDTSEFEKVNDLPRRGRRVRQPDHTSLGRQLLLDQIQKLIDGTAHLQDTPAIETQTKSATPVDAQQPQRPQSRAADESEDSRTTAVPVDTQNAPNPTVTQQHVEAWKTASRATLTVAQQATVKRDPAQSLQRKKQAVSRGKAAQEEFLHAVRKAAATGDVRFTLDTLTGSHHFIQVMCDVSFERSGSVDQQYAQRIAHAVWSQAIGAAVSTMTCGEGGTAASQQLLDVLMSGEFVPVELLAVPVTVLLREMFKRQQHAELVAAGAEYYAPQASHSPAVPATNSGLQCMMHSLGALGEGRLALGMFEALQGQVVGSGVSDDAAAALMDACVATDLKEGCGIDDILDHDSLTAAAYNTIKQCELTPPPISDQSLRLLLGLASSVHQVNTVLGLRLPPKPIPDPLINARNNANVRRGKERSYGMAPGSRPPSVNHVSVDAVAAQGGWGTAKFAQGGDVGQDGAGPEAELSALDLHWATGVRGQTVEAPKRGFNRDDFLTECVGDVSPETASPSGTETASPSTMETASPSSVDQLTGDTERPVEGTAVEAVETMGDAGSETESRDDVLRRRETALRKMQWEERRKRWSTHLRQQSQAWKANAELAEVHQLSRSLGYCAGSAAVDAYLRNGSVAAAHSCASSSSAAAPLLGYLAMSLVLQGRPTIAHNILQHMKNKDMKISHRCFSAVLHGLGGYYKARPQISGQEALFRLNQHRADWIGDYDCPFNFRKVLLDVICRTVRHEDMVRFFTNQSSLVHPLRILRPDLYHHAGVRHALYVMSGMPGPTPKQTAAATRRVILKYNDGEADDALLCAAVLGLKRRRWLVSDMKAGMVGEMLKEAVAHGIMPGQETHDALMQLAAAYGRRLPAGVSTVTSLCDKAGVDEQQMLRAAQSGDNMREAGHRARQALLDYLIRQQLEAIREAAEKPPLDLLTDDLLLEMRDALAKD